MRSIPKVDFYKCHQKRIATIVISSSSFRSQGPKGLISDTRLELSKIDLGQFANSLKTGGYRKYLDQMTRQVLKAVNKGQKIKWGTIRKGLNLFYRDISLSIFFQKELNLKSDYFKQLEIPLDSYSGKAISQLIAQIDSDFEKLRWSTIGNVTPEISEKYQLAAEIIAKKLFPKLQVVELDIVFWDRDFQWFLKEMKK